MDPSSGLLADDGAAVTLDFSKLSTSDVDFGLLDDAESLMLFGPGHDHVDAAPSVPKPYHAKRPHKKSRAGCMNCKRRKVKCSESRPACQNCVLRKDTCVYPKVPVATAAVPSASSATSQSSPASPHNTTLVSASSASSSRRDHRSPSVVSIDPADIITYEPMYRPAEMNDMTDMKLLWFYTTETFSSFSVETRRSRIVDDALRVKVVEHAFKSPFLMQCLLGLSALQLRSMGQPLTARKAAEYSSKAFEGYRTAIQNAHANDYAALLAASLLMCALSTEMFREKVKKPLCIVDWMTVWRGIGLIVEIITPKSIHESGLAVLFYRPPIDLEKTFRYIPNNLLFMVSSISSSDADYEHQQVYYDALRYLGSLYMELQHGFSPILDLRVITFFTFIPKLFLPLAREERPRALIILAHYLAFTKLNNNVWWMQGLADREIDEICDMLGDQWAPLTRVPRKVRHATDKVEVARIIIDNRSWQPAEEDLYNRNRDPRTASLRLINDDGTPLKIIGNEWVREDDAATPDGAAQAGDQSWPSPLPVSSSNSSPSDRSDSTSPIEISNNYNQPFDYTSLDPCDIIETRAALYTHNNPAASPTPHGQSPSSFSHGSIADKPKSNDPRGTSEEKWALMGQMNGHSRRLEEFAKASEEDELLTRKLNL